MDLWRMWRIDECISVLVSATTFDTVSLTLRSKSYMAAIIRHNRHFRSKDAFITRT